MSEFDNQSAGIFNDIHKNHMRSRTTKTIGYIVTVEQAHRLAHIMEAQSRQGDPISLALLTVQLFVLVAVTVVALA